MNEFPNRREFFEAYYKRDWTSPSVPDNINREDLTSSIEESGKRYTTIDGRPVTSDVVANAIRWVPFDELYENLQVSFELFKDAIGDRFFYIYLPPKICSVHWIIMLFWGELRKMNCDFLPERFYTLLSDEDDTEPDQLPYPAHPSSCEVLFFDDYINSGQFFNSAVTNIQFLMNNSVSRDYISRQGLKMSDGKFFDEETIPKNTKFYYLTSREYREKFVSDNFGSEDQGSLFSDKYLRALAQHVHKGTEKIIIHAVVPFISDYYLSRSLGVVSSQVETPLTKDAGTYCYNFYFTQVSQAFMLDEPKEKRKPSNSYCQTALWLGHSFGEKNFMNLSHIYDHLIDRNALTTIKQLVTSARDNEYQIEPDPEP